MYIGNGRRNYEFMQYFVTLIMREPISQEEEQSEEDGNYYPYTQKSIDRINRVYSGSEKMKKTDAQIIKGHFDTSKLDDELSLVDDEALCLMSLDFNKIGVDVEPKMLITAIDELIRLSINALSIGDDSFKLPAKYVYNAAYGEKNSIDAKTKEEKEISYNHKESYLEKMQRLLISPENWREQSNYDVNSWYYIYDPDFVIEYDSSHDKSLTGYEYYLFTQYDPTPYWTEIRLKYRNTVLDAYQGINLDSGRYFSPCPMREAIRPWIKGEPIIFYRFFVLGSLPWIINEFFFDKNNIEQKLCRQKFLDALLLFESEEEKSRFVEYAEYNWYYLDNYAVGIRNLCAHRNEISENSAEQYELEYRNAMIMKNMLLKMRGEKEKTF